MKTHTRRGFVARSNLLPMIFAILALLLAQTSSARGGDEPSSGSPPPDPGKVEWLSFDSPLLDAWKVEGPLSDSPLLHPGKLDFHFTRADAADNYNFIVWTPVFKGGVGTTDVHGGANIQYVGGFVRPFTGNPDLGDLILGFHHVDAPAGNDYEFQGEYRLPMGLGVGGGYVSRNVGPDTGFGKISYRNKVNDWNYILSAQLQEDNDDVAPGGYAAVHNEHLMVAGGTDGEQWRAAVGYVSPEGEGPLRPAAEVLYVDNTIGDLPGAKFLFVNGTLKFGGGFLSHPARLGRAMGPQGLEYGNPLGFLQPTWNRCLDVWELGSLVNVRFQRREFPNETVSEKYEAVAFPFQFDQQDNCLDRVFVGGFGDRTPAEGRTGGILAGIVGKLGFLNVNLAVEQDLETGETRAFVGAIAKL